jgi:undecaprenyl-diphosphatase
MANSPALVAHLFARFCWSPLAFACGVLFSLGALPVAGAAAGVDTAAAHVASAAVATAEPAPVDRRLNYRDAVILGVVEGITEYLPISSTGHLLLTNRVLGLDSESPLRTVDGQLILGRDGEPVTLRAAADAYAIVIQAGAILAVALLYWRRLWGMAMGLLGRDAAGLRLTRNLLVAFIPAVVLGLLLDDWIEALLFAPLPIAIALIAGGFLMLGVERWRARRTSSDADLGDMSIRQALVIGLLQCVAMWPGTSRSMMTIVGGYLAGLSPQRAAEFSFLLGLITLTAAAGYKGVQAGPALFAGLDLGPLLLGCFIAFVSAALAVKWLVGYLGRHGLALFAWYRFGLGILVLIQFVWL